MDFAGAIETWRRVLTQPGEPVFEQEKLSPNNSLQTALIWMVVAGVVEADRGHRHAVDRAQVAPFRRQHAPGRPRGDRPQVVDMPPLWAHSIKNVGSSQVTTIFWSNELFDPEHPDTYMFPVYGRYD